jgi:uncharacterized membrane protein YdbT with pleckstrin-like domain
MAYYLKVLQPGETVRYLGRLHWLIYAGPLSLVFLAVVFALAAAIVRDSADWPSASVICVIAALLCLVLAALRSVRLFIRRWTTEIVVTDRRVIFKTGWISRHTLEMNITKIETVDVDQPIVGRLFGYGTVSVHGTGASMEPMRQVAHPLQLRNSILVG